MKTTVTYRIVAILALALVFAPVLNYSVAQTMDWGDLSQQQTYITSSSNCHQPSKMGNCMYCSMSLENQSCDHANGACDSDCSSHCVITVAITTQASDSPNARQIYSDLREQFALNFESDSQLRPPQFV